MREKEAHSNRTGGREGQTGKKTVNNSKSFVVE